MLTRVIGGELVREARKRMGLTQRELAKRSGTTQSAIARLESCRTDPSLVDVLRLIRLSGLDLRVALVPLDESDLHQAAALTRLDPEERLALNRRSVELADELRDAMLTASRG